MQLQQRESEINRLELRVAAVTFETLRHARGYVEETRFPWPMLIDESRLLYRTYGMERGSFREIWGVRNWGVYFRLVAQGWLPRLPHDDVNQLGGDVIVDPGGVVRLHHIGRGPADRPSVDSLLELITKGTRPAQSL